MKVKKTRKVCAVLLAAVIALVAIGVLTYNDDGAVSAEAESVMLREGEALAKQITGEGAVLVMNNGTLPLNKEDVPAVNIFGWGSSPRGWVMGGSGSGRVMSYMKTGYDAYFADTDITKAFENYGIACNSELTEMYTEFSSIRPGIEVGTLNTSVDNFYRIIEPDINGGAYTDELKSNALEFSDTAIIVISRIAGEAKDAPRYQNKQNISDGVPKDETRHYLELSTEEEGMIEYVSESYDNVIVIVNSTNTMELGFLEEYDGIDACLVVGGTGTNSANAIPEIIYGEINPSGRLADTYAYSFESNINYYHTGDEGEGTYKNGDDLLLVGVKQNAGSADRHGNSYVDYVEDIYLGYKWYETADAEGYWEDKGGYDNVVQFPFGFGLSYNSLDDYDWEILDVYPSPGSTVKADDEIVIRMLVENNGQYDGQDVVQVYYTPDYISGGIEKSEVELVAFAKTVSPIARSGFALLTLKFKVEDLASYDAYDKNRNGFKGYELDPGKFTVSLRTDAHTIKKVTFDGGASYVPGVIEYNVGEEGIRYAADSVTGAEVNNKFTGDDALDGVSIDGSDEAKIPFVSRADFSEELKKAPDRNISDKAKALNRYTEEMAAAWDEASTDLFGNPVDDTPVSNKTAVSSGLTLTKNNGKSATDTGIFLGNAANYDDETWISLLNQVSVSEMKAIICNGALRVESNDAIGMSALENLDGPSQIGGFSNNAAYRTVGYPNATVLAQTFNTRLAYDFGNSVASEGLSRGVRGWLGPAINMHRSPFGGRNYEYYSEDPYLTGMMAAYTVSGAKNAGVYVYLKHLVLYDQETNREALYTWTTEQNLRENYLEPFRIAVRLGGVTGIMTAYNRIGAVWTGGSEALITGVLRNEWGFKGAVITDYSDNKTYMNIDQAVRAGGNRFMGSNGWLYDNTADRLERRIFVAYKEYLFNILNSYNTYIYNTPYEDILDLTFPQTDSEPEVTEPTEQSSGCGSYGSSGITFALVSVISALLALWIKKLGKRRK